MPGKGLMHFLYLPGKGPVYKIVMSWGKRRTAIMGMVLILSKSLSNSNTQNKFLETVVCVCSGAHMVFKLEKEFGDIHWACVA